MATESLIVLLDAKTEKLDASLKKTQTRLDELEGKTTKADGALKRFTSVAKASAIAVTAVAAAVGIAINQAGKFAIELEVAANRSGESVESMQSLAFAASTVGISLEKLGDISKDTNEKIGEFLATGGGGFQDFIDVLGLTAIEARATAEEFERLSGPEILQAMTDRMQTAGISAERMSFALEGVASDATDLIPLLRDNGKELKTLREEFDELNITLSRADLEKIKEVDKALDKASLTFSEEGKRLIADYSEELINVIDTFVLLGLKAGQAFDVLSTGLGTPLELARAFVNDLVNGLDTFDDVLAEREAMGAEVMAALLGTTPEELGFEGGKALAEGMADGFTEGSKPLEIVITKGGKKLTEWEKLNSKERLGIQSKFIRASRILADTFLEDNKAINAGLIVADTAAGIMKAFATSSNIYEAYANAAVVAATGVAQLNNVLSASRGGGNVSSGVGSSTGSTGSQQTQQEDQDVSSLELTEQSESGVTTQRIILSTDDGEELLDALSKRMTENERQGR